MANNTTKPACTLDNIEYRENATTIWTVDDEGFPDVYIDTTEGGGFRCYYCDNCQEEFDSWKDVKEHLNEN